MHADLVRWIEDESPFSEPKPDYVYKETGDKYIDLYLKGLIDNRRFLRVLWIELDKAMKMGINGDI